MEHLLRWQGVYEGINTSKQELGGMHIVKNLQKPNSNRRNAKSLQKTNLKFTKYQITQKCKTIKPKISQITTIKYHNYILTTRF